MHRYVCICIKKRYPYLKLNKCTVKLYQLFEFIKPLITLLSECLNAYQLNNAYRIMLQQRRSVIGSF